jgi:cytochrome c-type biogenesis protein CcmH/NrfF
MGKELLLQQQQQDNPLLYEEEEQHKMFKDVEQEIECPRCSDMMALSSDFDRICYFC